MTRSKKVFLYAGAIAVGAIAAILIVPGLIGETNGQSPNVLVSPARAEPLEMTQDESLLVAQAEPTTPPSPSTFPGGATSVQESYGDWLVNCAIAGETKVCSMIQQQTNRESRQRVLVIELRRTDAGMEGALILPFGILLANGVTLKVDDGPAGDALSFRTCVPNGCLVPLDFDPEFVNALALGGRLNIAATADGGEEITFAVSLNGFSAASNRMAELLGG